MHSANSASIVEHEGLRQDAIGLHRPIQADRVGVASRQERCAPTRTSARCPRTRQRFERKVVGKPLLLPSVVLIVLVALAIVSRSQGWELARASVVDLARPRSSCAATRDRSPARAPRQRSRSDSQGGPRAARPPRGRELRRARNSGRRSRDREHLRSQRRRAPAHGVRDLHDGRRRLRPHLLGGRGRGAGRSATCTRTTMRSTSAFRRTTPAAARWKPQVWDYLYVSLTNSIAFSPTDTMPLSLRAKGADGARVVRLGRDGPPRRGPRR